MRRTNAGQDSCGRAVSHRALPRNEAWEAGEPTERPQNFQLYPHPFYQARVWRSWSFGPLGTPRQGGRSSCRCSRNSSTSSSITERDGVAEQGCSDTCAFSRSTLRTLGDTGPTAAGLPKVWSYMLLSSPSTCHLLRCIETFKPCI